MTSNISSESSATYFISFTGLQYVSNFDDRNRKKIYKKNRLLFTGIMLPHVRKFYLAFYFIGQDDIDIIYLGANFKFYMY